MALDDLKHVYQAVLLDYAASQKYRQPLASPTKAVSLVNESCGDRMTLQVKVKEGKIEQVACLAEGCTISQASAAIMAGLVDQAPLEKAAGLLLIFWRMLEGKEISQEEEKELGDAALLQGVSRFPARVKCAGLSWQGLREAIERKN
ncbi:SUF system NifU family Fe-S cluster assembly protein [Lactobacillus delbrueckii]|uniref:Fe-S cluster assembly sulfur transfer protein SufU n=1 Tax=Lactobacillus delbrueckii TaxID=1584 RepID=UPI0039C24CB8